MVGNLYWVFGQLSTETKDLIFAVTVVLGQWITCPPARTYDQTNCNQSVIDYKSVWGFFDIPIGCRENVYFEVGELNIFGSSWIKSV